MCLYPKKAVLIHSYEIEIGENIEKIIFCKNDETRLEFVKDLFGYEYDLIDLQCGKCVECLQQKSTEWSYRCALEASEYKDNCFITLTYANAPENLKKRDFQLFMKRLRKYVWKYENKRIRYFACGEYGSKGSRAHYHCCIFGWKPKDMILFNKKEKLYGSKILESIWQNGFISVSEFSIETAKYVTKYLQKLQPLEHKEVQPFLLMSNRPAIGWNKFFENCGRYIPTDKIYFNGNWIKIPKIYVDKMKKIGEFLPEIQKNRDNRIVRASLYRFFEEDLEKKRLVLERSLK